MKWIEGVTTDERGLRRLSLVATNGQVALGRLNVMRTSTPARGNLNLPFEGLQATELKLVSTHEYMELAGPWPGAKADHFVYDLRLAGLRLLIPAAVLILSFIMHMAAIGELLLYGASLDRVCSQCKVGRRAWRIRFGRDLVNNQKDEEATQSRFLWITGFPSARNMWASVSKYAQHGVLGIDLPKVKLDGAILGRRVGSVVLVTRFHIRKLVPLEAPLPSYPHLEGRAFVFNKRHLPATVGRREWEVHVPAEPSNFLGLSQVTDAEWLRISQVLLASGHRACETDRRRLDETLHVLATHGRWPWQETKEWYARRLRLGVWEEVEAAIKGMRPEKEALAVQATSGLQC